MDAAVPGTVAAVASLSGDVNPAKQIERAQRGELVEAVALKLSRAFACRPILKSCLMDYIEQWSPYVKASASAPPQFLAASEAERRSASLSDQYELAAKLAEVGVPAEVLAPLNGHGFAYWKAARRPALEFLTVHSLL